MGGLLLKGKDKMLALSNLTGAFLLHFYHFGSIAALDAGIPQLNTFIANIQKLLTGLGGGIFVICVVIAGLMRMISFGNERRVAISNMAFTAAVIGLAIVLLATAFGTFMKGAF